ncbi:hypothetical protein HDU67_007040 [Dinochytrium kinnereticum]|nr:hypothetical protein HDU67_007040 [Dinochytrium kinnereticum]
MPASSIAGADSTSPPSPDLKPARSISPPPALVKPSRRVTSSSPSGMMMIDGFPASPAPPMSLGRGGRGRSSGGSVAIEDDEMGYADDEGGGDEEDSRASALKGSPMAKGRRQAILPRSTPSSFTVTEDSLMSLDDDPVSIPLAPTYSDPRTVAGPSLPSLAASPETTMWTQAENSPFPQPTSPSWPASVLSVYPNTPWNEIIDMEMGDSTVGEEGRSNEKVPLFKILDLEGAIGSNKIPPFLLRPVPLNPDRAQLVLYRPVTAPPTQQSADTSSKTSSLSSIHTRRHSSKVDGNDGDDDEEGSGRGGGRRNGGRAFAVGFTGRGPPTGGNGTMDVD